jgi:N-acetylglucosamine kinase-like BadF-type ATPase
MDIISTIGLNCPVGLVNDCELGLFYGSPRGWGVVVVSGTGCNCRGWDVSRTKIGRVTGGGLEFGEFAGASELMFMTTHALAYEWTGRGPATALSAAYVEKYGVKDLHDLLQGMICRQIEFSASDALLVFKVAAEGDSVAMALVRQAGRGLGDLALTVIHQLKFESLDFDLVQIGSMFDGSPLLTGEMKKVVHAVAPGANFIRAKEPPVIGAVLLGMETCGKKPDASVREVLIQTTPSLMNHTGSE